MCNMYLEKEIKFDEFILKNWNIDFTKDLYKLAKNPNVSLSCGWLPHENIKDTNSIIQNILINNLFDENNKNYAVFLKNNNNSINKLTLIGSVGLKDKNQSEYFNEDNQFEIGYWLGEEFWGKGYMTKILTNMIDYLFDNSGLNINTIWCGYFKDNIKSKRVQEKCGFEFAYLVEDKEIKLIDKVKDVYITSITKERYLNELNY
ncbi:MAG: GNAT family N-acetyltransferase [bacterium]